MGLFGIDFYKAKRIITDYKLYRLLKLYNKYLKSWLSYQNTPFFPIPLLYAIVRLDIAD